MTNIQDVLTLCAGHSKETSANQSCPLKDTTGLHCFLLLASNSLSLGSLRCVISELRFERLYSAK